MEYLWTRPPIFLILERNGNQPNGQTFPSLVPLLWTLVSTWDLIKLFLKFRVCPGPKYHCKGIWRHPSFRDCNKTGSNMGIGDEDDIFKYHLWIEFRVLFTKIFLLSAYHHHCNDHPQHPLHPHLCNPTKVSKAKEWGEECRQRLKETLVNQC